MKLRSLWAGLPCLGAPIAFSRRGNFDCWDLRHLLSHGTSVYKLKPGPYFFASVLQLVTSVPNKTSEHSIHILVDPPLHLLYDGFNHLSDHRGVSSISLASGWLESGPAVGWLFLRSANNILSENRIKARPPCFPWPYSKCGLWQACGSGLWLSLTERPQHMSSSC